MIFIFLSTLVHEIPIWTLLTYFWVDKVTTGKTSRFWNCEFKNNYSPQISLYYWFSSFFHHWYMKYKFELFLTKFWFNEVTRRVKTAVFWESNLRNIFLTSKFDQILISIFLSPLIFLLASKPKAFMLSNHACKTEPCHQTITLNRF